MTCSDLYLVRTGYERDPNVPARLGTDCVAARSVAAGGSGARVPWTTSARLAIVERQVAHRHPGAPTTVSRYIGRVLTYIQRLDFERAAEVSAPLTPLITTLNSAVSADRMRWHRYPDRRHRRLTGHDY